MTVGYSSDEWWGYLNYFASKAHTYHQNVWWNLDNIDWEQEIQAEKEAEAAALQAEIAKAHNKILLHWWENELKGN